MFDKQSKTKFKKMSSTSDEDLRKDSETANEKDKLFDAQNSTEMIEIKVDKVATSPQFTKQMSTTSKKIRYEAQNSHDLTFFLQQQNNREEKKNVLG